MGAYWQQLPPLMVLLALAPFVLLLLLIAVLPLLPAASAWWELNRNKLLVAGVCGLAGVFIYALPTGDLAGVAHIYLEYLAFISLLASLFIVSGGIHISGSYAGFPWVNTLFLGLGAVLANVLGTTGASMLLIRPLLRANHHRRQKTHIVIFFIFLVSNCGGLLTPLGDPPLYLGFLRGVPFSWTLRLFPEWALAVFLLLFAFHLLDERFFEREDLQTKGALLNEVAAARKGVHIQGQRNFWLLAGILAVVVFAGYGLEPALRLHLAAEAAAVYAQAFQILALAGLALCSWRITPRTLHAENHFSFHPIQEVAALFFGLFGAMLPALAWIGQNAAGWNLERPWQYFWLSGALSSFLDNAPTYLSFATLAAGQHGIPGEHLGLLAARFPRLLEAISVGAVFMGANTYIGNGPNFMVKAIAEHAQVKMPSFGGYLLWSIAILGPVYLLQTLIFFR